MDNYSLQEEAFVFCKYLLGKQADEFTTEQYIRAFKDVNVSANEKKLITFAIKHPYTIRMLDGACALLHPHHELRKRIYYTFCIIESNPNFSHLFLTVNRSPLYLFIVAIKGVRAVVSTIVGILLLKTIN